MEAKGSSTKVQVYSIGHRYGGLEGCVHGEDLCLICGIGQTQVKVRPNSQGSNEDDELKIKAAVCISHHREFGRARRWPLHALKGSHQKTQCL